MPKGNRVILKISLVQGMVYEKNLNSYKDLRNAQNYLKLNSHNFVFNSSTSQCGQGPQPL